MGMLIRTRKSNFILFRVICVLSVTLIFYVAGLLKQDNDREVHGKIDNLSGQFGRHLLAYDNATDVEVTKRNCTPPTIDEFPPDGFTKEQRQNGVIIIHALVACYLFIVLAIVCDDYFIPAVKKFCDILNMKKDTAGATIMAIASSSPELFINCIGTFITEGDMGVGAIVGSAVFNVLAVPACCGLFANMVMEIEWWPITRDCVMYCISVIALIIVLNDGRIFVGEAIALVLIYSLYILLMCFNTKLRKFAHKIVAKFQRRNYYVEVMAETHPLLYRKNGKYHGIEEILDAEVTLQDCEEYDESIKIWTWPKEATCKQTIWWLITWPIGFVLFITIPDCRRYPKLCVVTFTMCIFWIGTATYIVSWIITIIGDTLNIPDSVMGLTFLAAGTSVPEAVSSVIVTRQGYATMGLSSSIGSNTFDILLCLGIPWLVKSAFYPKTPGNHWVDIYSDGINISACALLTTLVVFYLSFAFNKFQLDWKIGISCLITYLVFVTLASLVELNVFFVVNLPTCAR